jgi:Tol biopolymer transport system component
LAYVTVANGDWEIRLREAQSGWERTIFSQPSGAIRDLTFSPDGQHIAFSSGGAIWITGVNGETAKALVHQNGAIAESPTFLTAMDTRRYSKLA